MKGKNGKLSAKKYLEQLEAIETKIDLNKKRLKELKVKSTSNGAIRYDKDKVDTSVSDSKLEKDVVEYVDLEKTIAEQTKKFRFAKELIISQIYFLNNADYITVLFKIYVEYRTLHDAAKELGKSDRQVRRYYNLALRAFESEYTDLHYLT